MSLAKKIVSYRKRERISQADLAKKLKVTRSSLNEWESGNHKPRKAKLQEIAELIGLSESELLAELLAS